MEHQMEQPEERLTALGTGYAIATKCYTTCFTLSDGQEHFMIDTGGGSGVLTHLEQAGIGTGQIHHIFLSHCHTDHVMGAVWLLRMIGHQIQRGSYEGQLHLYCHQDIVDGLQQMCRFMLPQRLMELFGENILFHRLHDGMAVEILGRPTVFFDTCSKKTLQYGVKIQLKNGKTLTYLGDEPYRDSCANYAQGVDYLMHEAMCLESQAERFHPHQIQHSTVKDAACCADQLAVKQLILHHTEDHDMAHRKQNYTAEARQYFSGPVFVPDDLETILL